MPTLQERLELEKEYDELLTTIEIAVPRIRKSFLILKSALYAACLKQGNLQTDKADELYKEYMSIAKDFYLENQTYLDEQLNNS